MGIKVIISLLILVFIQNIINAKEISIIEARQVATNVFYERFPVSVNKVNQKIIFEEFTEYKNSNPIYYIFKFFNNNGFIIISADDCVHPILGYSFDGDFDFSGNDFPPALVDLLDNYKQQILFVKNNNLLPDNEIKAEWTHLKNGYSSSFKNTKSVSPLLSTNWDQDCYYNADCPADANAPGYICGHVYAGCVATAMAMVMKYHEYPATGIGSHSYSTAPYGYQNANFGNTTYNWANMPNNVNSSNASVAQLIYHCAVSVEMDFGINGSGAWMVDARNSLVDYFIYSNSAVFQIKSQYTNTNWINLLKDQLDNAKPMLYRGDGSSGGHAFVCDGYNGSNFHFNWGWSGYYNGYFNVSNLNPGTSSLTQNQGAIINITPGATVPIADFEANTSTILAGESINFYDLSYGIPASYNWSFPGGLPNSSTLQNPGNIVYSSIGNYNVTLSVANSFGTDTENKIEYIHVVEGFPDLIVQSFSISPQIIPPDSSVVSIGAIYNMSTYTAPQSILSFFISLDTNFNSLVDFQFHTENVPQLYGNQYFTFSFVIPMPYLSNTGTYYMFCVVDAENNIVETNNDNNESYQAVTIALPDLVIQNAQVSPIEIIAGEQIQATCILKNVGNLTADSTNLKLYLSENSIYESTDILMQIESIDSVEAQNEVSINASLTIPLNTAIGNWNIIFFADQDELIYESNEMNNYSFAQFSVDPPMPELQIINPSSSSSSVFAGDTLEISVELLNTGSLAAQASIIKYYLSEDSIVDYGSDIFLTSQTVDTIAIGNSIQIDTSIYIPGNTQVGTWVIIFVADATEQIQEENEDNNIQFLEINVLVAFPDLSIQNIFVSNSTIAAGAFLSLNCEVINTGYNFAEPSILNYYLSKSETIDSNSVLLSSDEVYSLVSTATSYESAEIQIPYSTVPDDYFILFFADAEEQISEINEDNNIESFQISVEEASSVMNTQNEYFHCFPNPSFGIFAIKLNSSYKNYTIEIYDIIGNLIYRNRISEYSNLAYKIDISKNPKGVYLLSVKSKNFSATEKIIVY